MSDKRELTWTQDLLRSFSYVEKSVNEQPMLVIAVMVMSVFSGLARGASFLSQAVAGVMYFAVAHELIHVVWDDLADSEEKSSSALRHGGPPLLSLCFLQVLFVGISLPLVLALLVPSIWWALKSSLAIVFVCLEDVGAIQGLKLSHQLIDGRFFLCLRYLAPIFLVLMVPTCLTWGGLDLGLEVLYQQPLGWPIMLGATTIASLLKGASLFFSQLLLIACLVRLYLYLKDKAPDSQATAGV